MPAVLKELTSGDTFELGEFALIGRNEGVTIRLADASISRQHATIRREAGDFWIVDLGSANGSYVNNVALTSARVLRHGDRVQLGTLVLTFQQEVTAPDTFSTDAKTTVSFSAPAPVRNAQATLFVADLKGFTALSARLAPGEVADLLREWYDDCTRILQHHGASIDKFIGDCVFAYWHRTEARERASALRAAQALRQAEFEPTSPTRIMLRDRDSITLDCRIGLHVGTVAFGAMGKGINTALGDAVNAAFRIESMTRVVDRPVLVSAAFIEGLPPEALADFEDCGEHAIKGMDAPLTLYAPSSVV